jgi:hypothetical protein
MIAHSKPSSRRSTSPSVRLLGIVLDALVLQPSARLQVENLKAIHLTTTEHGEAAQMAGRHHPMLAGVVAEQQRRQGIVRGPQVGLDGEPVRPASTKPSAPAGKPFFTAKTGREDRSGARS